MNNLRLKPLTLALIATFAVASTAVAGVEPRLHEDISVTPGRSISPADEDVISSSASRVLHHIARARAALRKNEPDQAKQELRQAETLLDIIQNSVPTTMVKNRVWTADDKLKYESTEEVPASIVPIYASLDERADFDTVKLPDAAKKDPQTDKKPLAGEEAEAKGAVLFYEELDLPLNATRHFVAAAQTDLARNRYGEAGQALRAALDSVDFVSVYLPAPLLAARINLERAEAHYGAGQKDAAKADLSRAIAQLAEAGKQADPDSQADVKQMLGDAQSLQGRLDKNEPGFRAELKGLWRRAEAHADRAMAYTSFGWAKLRQHDSLRDALIEAKRYVAYADIDANVAGDASKAMGELTQARGWLDKAAEASAGKAEQGEAVYVKDIRAVVDTLLSGQAKPGSGEMANLKQQLEQAIARS
jgi:tetratricopeptide (TPR) repeat protein